MLPLLALAQAVFIVPSGQNFTCTPVAIWDGDGPIWCAEGPHIRLAGVAAREIDETCRRGHPCPKAGGEAARDALVRLVGRKTGVGRHGHVLVTGAPMSCLSRGAARGTRTSAWCWTASGEDLSCAMYRRAMVVRWPAYGGASVCRVRQRGRAAR